MGCAVSNTEHVGIEPVRKRSKDIEPWPEEAQQKAPKDTGFNNMLKNLVPDKAPADTESGSKFKALASIKQLYDVEDLLGRGSYAEVRVCVDKKSKVEHAVKILEAPKGHEKAKAMRELDVWRRLGAHKNITELLYSYVDGDIFYFVMPRCSCSIFDMLKMNGGILCNDFLFGAICQVFQGLEHCHSSNIIHRDIKAANLLVDFAGNVKLADFGLSVDKPPVGKSGFVGSVPYMSPEMVKGEYYGFQTDIWSSGVVIYCCVYGRYPYEPTNNLPSAERKKHLVEAIATNKPPPKYEPKDCIAPLALSVQKFIETVLVRDQNKRPDATLCSKLSLDLKEEQESGPEASSRDVIALKVSFKEDHEKAESSLATTCPADGLNSSSLGVVSDHVLQSYMI